jgi:hypothetical protein
MVQSVLHQAEQALSRRVTERLGPPRGSGCHRGTDSKTGTVDRQEPERKGMDDLHRERRSGRRARWPRGAQGVGPGGRRRGGQ